MAGARQHEVKRASASIPAAAVITPPTVQRCHGSPVLARDRLTGTHHAARNASATPKPITPTSASVWSSSLDAWRKTAALFNEMAEKAGPEGLLVGYHNHTVEFKQIDGQVPWDVFAAGTAKEVVLQLDTGNCMAGGGDPVAYLKKYPGRAVTAHLKEHGGKNALIGDGDVKWSEFLPLCEKVGGTEWFIVEQERYPKPPLESIGICLANLKRLLGRR